MMPGGRQRGRPNKPRQTVYKPPTKEKQSNQTQLPQKVDHNAIPEPPNTTINGQPQDHIRNKEHENHQF